MESKHPPTLCQWSPVPQKHRLCWSHFVGSFTPTLGKEQEPYNACSASGGCSALYWMYFSEHPFSPILYTIFWTDLWSSFLFCTLWKNLTLYPSGAGLGTGWVAQRTWCQGFTSPREQLIWDRVTRWFEVRPWLGAEPYCIFPLPSGFNHGILRQSLTILFNFYLSVESSRSWIFHGSLFLLHLPYIRGCSYSQSKGRTIIAFSN